MANILRSLIVDLRTRTAKFQAGMRGAGSELKRFRGQVNTVNRQLSVFSGTLAGVGGAAGLLLLTKRAIDAGDQIQKLSVRLGASTEALSQYRFVAERSGVSFQTLTTGIQRMTRRIAEAAVGTGEAQGALRELGLGAETLSTQRISTQFETVAQALSEVENSSDRVRLAMKLFDTEGVALLQTMQDGAQGIRELRDRADQLGLTLTQEAADKFALAKDKMAEFDAAAQGLSQTLAITLLDSLTNAAKGLTTFMELMEGATLRARLAEIATQIKTLREKIAELDKPWWQRPFGTLRMTKEELDQLGDSYRRQIESLQKLRDLLIELRGAGGPGQRGPIQITKAAGVSGPIIPDVPGRDQTAQFARLGDIENEAEFGGAEDARVAALREAALQMATIESQITQQMQQEADKRARISEVETNIIGRQREQLGQLSVGLLQALGAKSKTAAIAAIALGKGLAIAQTIQQTQVAAMRARAELGILGGGEAAAARIQAIGRASVGIIAATGLVQAASVGGGGASAGAPGGPPLETTAGRDFGGGTAFSRPAATVTIVNPIGSRDFFETEIVPIMRDLFDNHDVVFFSNNSRQAREVREF